MVYQDLLSLGFGERVLECVGPVECVEVQADDEVGVKYGLFGFLLLVFIYEDILVPFCQEAYACRGRVGESYPG